MPSNIRQAVISPEILIRVGQSLFGNNWVTALARELDMTERSVRYMITGERGIHAGIVRDLIDILEEHRAEQHEAAKILRSALRSQGTG